MTRLSIFTVLTTGALMASTSLVSAQSSNDFSYDFKIGIGSVTNTYGGAGLDLNRGMGGAFTRGFVELDSAVAFGLGSGEMQFDLNYATLAAPENGDADSTQFYGDIALHYSKSYAGLDIGGFAGYGISEDNGDTDLTQSYYYVGVEARKTTSFGLVYGSIGYLDSDDEYDEGPNNAPFASIGVEYDINEKLTLSGDVTYVGGHKASFAEPEVPSTALALTAGISYQFSDKLSAFAEYEYDRIYSDVGYLAGDTFQNIQIGVQMSFGAKSTWDTPSLGRIVSFAANEIEQE